MDSRILPQYKVEDVEKKIRALADCAEARYKVKIEIQAVEKAPAAPHTAANAPVVLALKKAVKQVYRQLAKAAGIGGMTAAVTFRNAGFAAAVWSRIDDTAHQPNEYCVIDNMVGDAKVFAHVFLQKLQGGTSTEPSGPRGVSTGIQRQRSSWAVQSFLRGALSRGSFDADA